jgi:tRNA (guanine37-N1)-methyltransferase
MVLTDAVCRLLPGVLGNASAHDEESVYSGLLEYPQYTRPAVYRDDSAEGGIDLTVPEVLTSGNHKEIRLWNFRKSLELTAERRPDLLRKFIELHEDEDALPEEKRLSKAERKILAEYQIYITISQND